MSYRIKHTMVDHNREGDIVDENTFDPKGVDRLIKLGAIEKTTDKPTHDNRGDPLTAAAEAEKRDRATVGLPDGDDDVAPAAAAATVKRDGNHAAASRK